MANLLSLGRGLLALPFAYCMLQASGAATWAAAGILLLAIASDLVDGPVARRAGTASACGRSLDHGADVLFVLCGLGPAALRGAVPVGLPVLVLVAFLQYAVDSYWLHREGQLRMSALGRWNGVLYFVPITVDIAIRMPELWAAAVQLLRLSLTPIAWLLMATSLASIGDRLLSLRRPQS